MKNRLLATTVLCMSAVFGTSGCESEDATEPGNDAGPCRDNCGEVEEPEPPPSDYEEVGALYEGLRDAVGEAGRSAVDLLVAGQMAELHARFTAEHQARVSVADLEAGLAELQSVAVLGDRVGERIVPPDGVGGGSYFSHYQWGEQVLFIAAAVDPAGLIEGMDASPAPVLPPDPRADMPTRSELRPPLEGVWLVTEGPQPEIANHHIVAPNQRHAYDIVVWRDGASFRGDGRSNEDHFAWRQPLLAPAAGTVITVLDGMEDIAPDPEAESGEGEHPAGNHVVLDLGNSEFAFFAHLHRGSVEVAEGDRVEAGDRLGLVGNSGNTSAPHIHFHVQDKAEFFDPEAIGVPAPFSNYLRNGALEERSSPNGEEFFQPRR